MHEYTLKEVNKKTFKKKLDEHSRRLFTYSMQTVSSFDKLISTDLDKTDFNDTLQILKKDDTRVNKPLDDLDQEVKEEVDEVEEVKREQQKKREIEEVISAELTARRKACQRDDPAVDLFLLLFCVDCHIEFDENFPQVCHGFCFNCRRLRLKKRIEDETRLKRKK